MKNKKKDFFEQIDIFVLPSTNPLEAFGIVQLEAMSYGIPVVSSNLKGVKSIIEKTKNGYSFISNDVNDLLSKIVLLNKKKIDHHKIQQNVINHYNQNKFKTKISELLKST